MVSKAIGGLEYDIDIGGVMSVRIRYSFFGLFYSPSELGLVPAHGVLSDFILWSRSLRVSATVPKNNTSLPLRVEWVHPWIAMLNWNCLSVHFVNTRCNQFHSVAF